MPHLVDMIGNGAMPQTQGHPNWVRQRCGYLTGSRLKDVIAYKSGGWTQATDAVRTKYMRELVAERMTDSAISHYVTDAMQHGIDTELEALMAYQATQRTGECRQAEFMLHPSIEYFGGTPDGLVGAQGIVEIKCPATTTYVAWRASGSVPVEHMPQMAAYIMITGRSWCDFVAYDPRIKRGPKLYVKRYTPSIEDLAFVAGEAQEFLRQTDKLFRLVTETP